MRLVATTLAAALLASAAPSAAEVAATTDVSFITKDSVTVAASPRETWLALIKPAEWWNDAHSWSGDAANMTLVPSAGGCFCETIPGEGDIPLDGSAQHAVVVQAIPDEALRLRGGFGPLQGMPGEGVLTITLEPVDGGTRIVWEYYFGGVMNLPVDQTAKAVDGVMSEQLHRLRDRLGPLGD